MHTCLLRATQACNSTSPYSAFLPARENAPAPDVLLGDVADHAETVDGAISTSAVTVSVTEISYHIWSGDYTRTFYTPHR